jgi:hypothetical protein
MSESASIQLDPTSCTSFILDGFPKDAATEKLAEVNEVVAVMMELSKSRIDGGSNALDE